MKFYSTIQYIIYPYTGKNGRFDNYSHSYVQLLLGHAINAGVILGTINASTVLTAQVCIVSVCG